MSPKLRAFIKECEVYHRAHPTPEEIEADMKAHPRKYSRCLKSLIRLFDIAGKDLIFFTPKSEILDKYKRTKQETSVWVVNTSTKKTWEEQTWLGYLVWPAGPSDVTVLLRDDHVADPRCTASGRWKRNGFRWFYTQNEAEEFIKTLK